MTVDLNNKPNNPSEADMKALIEKNIELSNEILAIAKGIKSSLMWQSVFGFIKVLFIVIPLILGIMYLPPLLKELFKSYQDALGISNTMNMDINSIKKSPAELFKGLK